VDLKGAQGVAVVGRHEHRGGHPLDAHRLDHLEAVQAGHLHVEEDQVGVALLDRL